MDNEEIEKAYIQVFHNENQAVDNKPNLNVVKERLAGSNRSTNYRGQDIDVIAVPFNPSTLSFSMRDSAWSVKDAERKKKMSLLQSGQREVAAAFAEHPDSSISVSFRLIFDKTMEENADVQSDVQQFLALVQDPYVRQVAFCWGDLSYKGLLKNVETEYVLFNALGNPTRATINLTLEGV